MECGGSAMADIDLIVKGMTCQGCVRAVEKIIRASDPAAVVRIELASGHVHLTTKASVQTLTQALSLAGYEAAHV
jgi:copper chaperone